MFTVLKQRWDEEISAHEECKLRCEEQEVEIQLLNERVRLFEQLLPKSKVDKIDGKLRKSMENDLLLLNITYLVYQCIRYIAINEKTFSSPYQSHPNCLVPLGTQMCSLAQKFETVD